MYWKGYHFTKKNYRFIIFSFIGTTIFCELIKHLFHTDKVFLLLPVWILYIILFYIPKQKDK